MRMLKIILVTFLVSLSTFTFAQDDMKAEGEAKFKQFLTEAAESRRAQADKMYQLKLELLNQEHSDQKKLIDEINALSMQMEFGDRDHNKKLKGEIKRKWRSMKEVQEKNRGKIEELREKFKKENKDRRLELKKLMRELHDKD